MLRTDSSSTSGATHTKEGKSIASSSSTSSPKKNKLDNAPVPILQNIGSYLDANPLSKFSSSSKYLNFLFKAELGLLHHVYQANLNEVEALCKIPHFDRRLLLKRAKYRERCFGKNTICREQIGSPIEAAAYSANNFMLRKLLNFLHPMDKREAIQQLLGVLNNVEYLLPYLNLMQALPKYQHIMAYTIRRRVGRFETARVFKHTDTEKLNWLQNVALLQERLPAYGVKKYLSRYFFQIVSNPTLEQIIENECSQINPSQLFLTCNSNPDTQYLFSLSDTQRIYHPEPRCTVRDSIDQLHTYTCRIKKIELTYLSDSLFGYWYDETSSAIVSMMMAFYEHQKRGLENIINSLFLSIEQDKIPPSQNISPNEDQAEDDLDDSSSSNNAKRQRITASP